MIFDEKIEDKVYVNQHDFVSDIQTPSRSWFLLYFLHELLIRFTIRLYTIITHNEYNKGKVLNVSLNSHI
jgi:hypothetical protein